MFTRIRTAVVACAAGAVLTAAIAAVATATPAMAYGKANWQTTFAGTATFPSTGNSFGFWGWCDFAGGVASGNSGDCQLAQYVHAPAGSGSGFTCHESIDLTAWTTTTGTFVITGSATVSPTAVTAQCLKLFPGSSPFAGVDSGIPAAAGQYHSGVDALAPGAVGEFNITVTQVP
jgi:hypothetical protein